MKKAVPLALLLASSAMAGPMEGTWVVGAAPTSGSNAATCCYLKAGSTLTVSGTSLVGVVDSTGQTASTGACKNYIAASGKQIVLANVGANSAFTDTLTPTTATVGAITANGAGGASTNANANTNALTVSTSDTGVTLNWIPSDATASSTTQCVTQPITRSPLTLSSFTSSASFSAATGTGTSASSCCFFDTTQNVVIAPANNKITATGKLGGTASQCSTTGSTLTLTLKAGADANTLNDLTDAQSFVFNSGRTTATYKPAANCEQVLTLVSSSALRTAGASAIVGATVLGLVVV